MTILSLDPETTTTVLNGDSTADNVDSTLHELLTVDEVAAVLKVSKSWVYEHTRSRGTPRSEQLPHIKVGKYVRFDPRALRTFIARKSRT